MSLAILQTLSFISRCLRSSPTGLLPTRETVASKSQRLLEHYGLLRHGAVPGTFALSPLLTRSLMKLIRIIEEEIALLPADKIVLPMLGSAQLWTDSGRLSEMKSDMFHIRDRASNHLCLQPTHEEEMVSFFNQLSPLSHKDFPQRLYQMGWKFRDEPLPRNGLLRAREFLMKDLYSFHTDLSCAEDTYAKVFNTYTSILNRLGLDFLTVEGSSGSMGGSKSHEFHVAADVGEDTLQVCEQCNVSRNKELDVLCPKVPCQVRNTSGIEVAHCFLLGTRYSDSLGCAYVAKDGKRYPVQMGCYGIGVTRLLAAALESMSTDTEIRWPSPLVPYNAAVIFPKFGAKDDLNEQLRNDILVSLENYNEVIIDDRNHLTIGKRNKDHVVWGLPYSLVVKRKDTKIHVELIKNLTRMSKLHIVEPNQTVTLVTSLLSDESCRPVQ